MTREIKFRAWHPKVREMNMVDCIDWDENGYLTEVNAGYCWAEKFTPEDFHRLVLTQYTGLKDKNGKEIYEGDVIAQEPKGSDVKGRDVVEWAEGSFENYYGFVGWKLKYSYEQSFTQQDTSSMEVIGNIYENPDLLTNTKEI